MTLTLLELRRLAQSPILWGGVVLVTAGTLPDIMAFWPMLEGNDLIAHDSSLWLMAFAALGAGWLGLRDRRTGAEPLVSVTPADAAARIVPARIAALVAASLAAFAFVFGAVLAVTATRGGQGSPDPRLYLDGALLVALGGGVGYGLGYLTGSRTVCLFAAPALPAFNQLLLSVAFSHATTGPKVDWGWLLPSVWEPQRSVVLGFLPDIWTGHITWLGALVALVCGGISLIAARRAGARRTMFVSLAVLAMGGLLGTTSSAWLMSRPRGVTVFGPDTVREFHEGDDFDYRARGRLARQVGPWPNDGRARTCATESGFEVCVYPEFGSTFARQTALEYAHQARFLRGLDDFPSRARMVPVYWAVDSCTSEELLYFEHRNDPIMHAYDVPLMGCVWAATHEGESARRAVTTWLFAEAHPETRSELASERIFGGPAVTRAGLALAAMPVEDARTLLARKWDELVRGSLRLSALPGARE